MLDEPGDGLVESVGQRCSPTDGANLPDVPSARQCVGLSSLDTEDLDDLAQVLGQIGVHHDGEIADLAVECGHVF